MVRKILKIVGIVLLLIVVALFAIPYLFENQIKAKIAEAINEKVDAKVSFADADLSLFRSFPQANVSVDKLLILNKAPFEGDTLVSLGELNLQMSIKELFKSEGEPMEIASFDSTNGIINILFNKDGVGNFDIALKEEGPDKGGESSPMSMKIQEYHIKNLRFQYYDERSKVRFAIDSLNHSGSGNFAASKLDLTTKSDAKISLKMDQNQYMKSVPLSLDAVLGIDLENSVYTFKDNKALINKLPLTFNGSISLLEQGQQYDLTFNTASSGFENFLSLIPSAYSGSVKDVTTTGDFKVSGFAKGIYSDNTVPKFNIAINSDNASFRYPNLPKSVQDIVIDTKIINETGILNDTYVNLDKLTFRIDNDVFAAKANIKNVVENPLVSATLKGTINLSNLSRAYPVKLEKPLAGMLKADVTTNFDMQAVKDSRYDRIKNAGTISLSQFKYVDENGKPLNISEAVVAFNPDRVNLQKFSASTGKTDLSVNGTLDNFYGFLFSNQELKGNFRLNSNQFAVSDFITETTPTDKNANAKKEEAIKIPAFLNCVVDAKMNTILYDNLVLRDASGKITIKDQAISLDNIRSNIFGGLITANGKVSTKQKTPVFDMKLNLNQVNIQETFTQLDMLTNIAPIAGVVNGRFNSTINLSGTLDEKEMTPNMSTLTGDLFGQFLSTTINASNSQLLNSLSSQVKFIDLKKLNLNDLKAALSFANGKVTLKPLELKYQDIKVQVGGQHGFDQSMLYNLKFDVPAKYLGPEVNKLLATLTPAEASKLDNIPITANMTGNFKNPKISTDMQKAVGNLASQLVQIQKDRLIRQGTSALGNILGGTKKDSAKPANTKDDIRKQAENVIKDLFPKKKKAAPKTE